MVIRLGYVAVSRTIYEYVRMRNVTYTTYVSKGDEEVIDSVIRDNLDSLKKILVYNVKNNIHFYRISSDLI